MSINNRKNASDYRQVIIGIYKSFSEKNHIKIIRENSGQFYFPTTQKKIEKRIVSCLNSHEKK